MKKFLHLSSFALFAMTSASYAMAENEIISTFNADKVIIPCSEYTPGQPYSAQVWVLNTGERYSDQHYNKIWGTPDADSQGREWYAPDYDTSTVTENITWQQATAPFSSDEYYKGAKSFRWITAEIMGEIYMRRTFTLSQPIEGTVFLACGHDDAPSEWYINGQFVHSVADGWNNGEYLLLSDEQKALLKTDGTPNVIACHVHQNWGGAFADCGLYAADMTVSNQLLPTVAKGEWPCKYYILNYNSDIELAESASWSAVEENEDEWISGIGPFSNDNNMFYITEWPSQVRPILVRRHFNLTKAELDELADATIKLLCSYDENPKIYLNGTLLTSYSRWNDNNYAELFLTDEQKQLLREGDNVLAVSLTSGEGGGHIDFGLMTEAPYGSSQLFTPATGTQSVTNTDNRIFNLQGQYVGTSPDRLPKGLYIKGGKKLILGK